MQRKIIKDVRIQRQVQLRKLILIIKKEFVDSSEPDDYADLKMHYYYYN